MPHYYVINLQRSTERLSHFISSLGQAEKALTRIDAIDGRLVAEDHYEHYDIKRFIAINGRHPRPGEYGCYRSHIKAIETFAKSAHQTAVIFEDDAKVTKDGLAFCQYLDEIAPEESLIIRLTTHRKALYEPLSKTHDHYSIGQSWFGPTGSAAAYWLNKPAAHALLNHIKTGSLPFDIALEASWHHGVPSLMTKPNVFPRPTPPSSDINYDADPRYKKQAFLKRLPVLMFRISEAFKRAWQALKTRRLPF